MNLSTTKIVAIVAAVVIVAAGAAVYVVHNGSDDEKVKIDAALEVYGNADGDYKIDSADLKIIENIIAGKEGYTFAKHPLADANYDGKVNADDVTLVKAILAKEKTTVWHINHNTAGDTVASTKWPITSALASGAVNMLMVYALTDIGSSIKGVNYSALSPPDSKLYPTYAKMKSVGPSTTTVDMDTVSTYVSSEKCTAILAGDNKVNLTTNEVALEKMGVDVVRLKAAAVSAKELGSVLLLVGFLFQKENRALEVTSWITSYYKGLESKLKTIPENKRVSAVVSSSENNVSTKTSDYTDVIRMAGAKCPVDSRDDTSSSIVIGDWLYVGAMNPDKVIHMRTGTAMGGSWYDNSVSKTTMKKSADCFKLTKAYTNKEVYVTSGDMPVVVRVAYSAAILYPEVFSMSAANETHQEFVDKFLNKAYKVSDSKFVYTLAELSQ